MGEWVRICNGVFSLKGVGVLISALLPLYLHLFDNNVADLCMSGDSG